MERRQVLTTADLAQLGLGPEDVRRLVRSQTLFRLRRGVYRRAVDSDPLPRSEWPPEESLTRHRQLVDATLPDLDVRTVLSHVSAGVIHDLPVPLSSLATVTTLRSGSGSGSITRVTHARRAQLPAEHVESIEGVPVTTLPRTVADLARTLPFRDGVAVVDAALARGVEAATLRAHLFPQQPGNRVALATIEFGDARSESPGESRCRATIHLAGLPRPELQWSVTDAAGAEVARVDFAWPELGLVGEYDGLVKYGRLLAPGQSVDAVLEAEKSREAAILRAGFWVARWTRGDLGDVKAFRRQTLAIMEVARRRIA